jgi:3-hydroxyacyl-CoA dehydrogenase
LALADFIGLDVCLDIMRVLHGGSGGPENTAMSAFDQDGGGRATGQEVRTGFLQVLRMRDLSIYHSGAPARAGARACWRSGWRICWRRRCSS